MEGRKGWRERRGEIGRRRGTKERKSGERRGKRGEKQGRRGREGTGRRCERKDGGVAGGDYRDTEEARNRSGMEEHPLHLHGHKFWVCPRFETSKRFSSFFLFLPFFLKEDLIRVISFPNSPLRLQMVPDNFLTE